MALPASVTKIRSKKGQVQVEFISNVDRANYTIQELTKSALRDVKKFVLKIARTEIASQMKTHTGKLRKNTQGWVHKNGGQIVLDVGFKNVAWYGGYQELGTNKQPKKGILFNSVADNIDQIRTIEAQYLSAIEDEQKAISLIDESEDSPDAD